MKKLLSLLLALVLMVSVTAVPTQAAKKKKVTATWLSPSSYGAKVKKGKTKLIVPAASKEHNNSETRAVVFTAPKDGSYSFSLYNIRSANSRYKYPAMEVMMFRGNNGFQTITMNDNQTSKGILISNNWKSDMYNYTNDNVVYNICRSHNMFTSFWADNIKCRKGDVIKINMSSLGNMKIPDGDVSLTGQKIIADLTIKYKKES